MEQIAVKKETLRHVTGNAIQLVIDGIVSQTRKPELRQDFRTRICTALNISKSYTQMLNNKLQPTTAQLAVIAQVLEVTVDDLLVYAE